MEDKKLTIRIPNEIYELLEEAAEEDYRSVNAELVYLIREVLMKRQDVSANMSEAAAQMSNTSRTTEGATPQFGRPNRSNRKYSDRGSNTQVTR